MKSAQAPKGSMTLKTLSFTATKGPLGVPTGMALVGESPSPAWVMTVSVVYSRLCAIAVPPHHANAQRVSSRTVCPNSGARA